jgi:phage FluMu protein Com
MNIETTTSKKAKVNGKEVRCGANNCNRKLGEFTHGEGAIKCPKCGTLNEVKVNYSFTTLKTPCPTLT